MSKLYQAYYTKSDTLVTYMIRQLQVKPGLRILEPAAGDGVFIEALVKTYEDIYIDAYDLNPIAIDSLKGKFGSNCNIAITFGDALTDEHLAFYSDAGGIYDRVIANPPYGAWQDYDKRDYLKKMYKGLYVKETYSLFLYRSIGLLKNLGILVFIIPDTFLNLHMHTTLRRTILTQTKILEIALFPSSFFPGVNFGYSNLSIITLQKCAVKEQCLSHNIRVVTDFSNVDELAKENGANTAYSILQGQVLNNIDSALFIASEPHITNLINNCSARVGDIADCVTGFYSGDDKQFLHALSSDIRNGSRYKIIEQELIANIDNVHSNLLDGIDDIAHYVPIVKGGGLKYVKPDLWFLDWSEEAVTNYKNNKKARFQNSSYYFRFGIGIPMISSTQITAALIENKLFDQSIVGVFPKDARLTYYLLGFFNSPTCNKLIRTINPSANNPANYIKKIPFIAPTDEQLTTIDTLITGIIRDIRNNGTYNENDEQQLHALYRHIYDI